MATETLGTSFDLSFFTLSEVTRCGAALRRVGSSTTHMTAAASGAVEHLYNHFSNPINGKRSLALARFFIVMPYSDLGNRGQGLARAALHPQPPTSDLPCLALLATMGREPDWNSISTSRNHQVLPVGGPKFLDKRPMLGQLCRDFALLPDQHTERDAQEASPHPPGNHLFHVAEAQGHPHIPDQESFVHRYGIRSVLGFGETLTPRYWFIVMLFSCDAIPPSTAAMFNPLGLSLKVALLKCRQIVPGEILP